MADNESTFAEQVVEEKSEFQQIQERIQNYKITTSPQVAQLNQALLAQHLASGKAQLDDLDGLITVRNELKEGLSDYQQAVVHAQKRLGELAEQEQLKKQEELAAREQAHIQKLSDERQLRKSLQDRVKILEAQLEALSGLQGNVAPRPHIDDAYDADLSGTLSKKEQLLRGPDVEPSKPKSKAWDMIRATRPDATTTSIDEQMKELAELELDDDTGEEEGKLVYGGFDIPEDAKGTDDFLAEVERVEAEQEVIEKAEEEKEFIKSIFEDERSIDEQLDDAEGEYGYEDLGEDLPVEDLRVAEEDTTTTPNFSKPVVSGGNAPNLKAVVADTPKVTAPLEEEPKKVIPSYDSEEELLAAAQAKIDAQQEVEEEFEEISIPDVEELQAMRKLDILAQGEVLGFELDSKLSKAELIEQFQTQVEAFVEQLKEDGEFVQVREDVKDEFDFANEEKEDDDKTDVRDGGYF